MFVVLALFLTAFGVPHAAADTTGLIRVAHVSPDTPAMDVALAPLPAGGGPLTDAGPDLATGLAYGTVSEYTAVAPGRYAVSLRPAGSPSTIPPALTGTVEVPAGQARTIAVSGPFAGLTLTALPDDLTAPAPGMARVRTIAASAAADPIDVGVQGGPPLATALRFGAAAAPVDVPAGPAAVVVDGAAPVAQDWPAGSISTLLVLDAPGGGLSVRSVLDAAGPAAAPVGAVEAGGGGSAGAPAALWALGAAGALAAVSRRGRVLALVAAAVVGGAPSTRAVTAPAERVVAAASDADPAAAPVRLQVPAAGVDTTLTSLGLDDQGRLVPPADDALAGWYRSGPAPGDTGPAVITGHVDSVAGPAVFFRLRDLAAGDVVTVTRADGTAARFTVTRVARYPKDAFPAAAVYAPTTGRELRLITCGGAFDRSARSYVDDVVVYAAIDAGALTAAAVGAPSR